MEHQRAQTEEGRRALLNRLTSELLGGKSASEERWEEIRKRTAENARLILQVPPKLDKLFEEMFTQDGAQFMAIFIYLLVFVLLVCGLVFSLTRFNFWRLPRPPFLPRSLMFHATDLAPWPGMRAGLNVNPELLEFMLGYLKRKGYVFVTADELLTFRDPVRHVCLTFDDGYEDNYTYLFPLLKKYQTKVTIFAAQRSVFDGKPMLTPAQIKEMSDSGLVEFGSHTLNHIKLTSVSEEVADREIREGKAYIESITGKPCTSFCYPFGQFTDRDIALLKQHGIKCSFTCEKGIFRITDPYRIHRLSAHGRMRHWQFPLVLSRGKYKV